MEEIKTPQQLMWDIDRAYKPHEKRTREEIMELYRSIPDKNITGSDKNETLIHIAASHADHEVLEYLISEGAKAGAKNSYGQTALHYLASKSLDRYADMDVKFANAENIEKCVDILLRERVSPLLKDDGSAGADNAYHLAMKSENFPFIYALIKHKVKLDMSDKDGRNLLHLLVTYPAKSARHTIRYVNQEDELAKSHKTLDYCFDLAKALIEYGLDPDAKDNTKRSPAEYAVEEEISKLAILLSGEYDESDTTLEDKIASGGKTLHKAAEDGDIIALEALIRLGADLNEVNTEEYGNYENRNPLAIACYCLRDNCVKALLDAGANPNFRGGEKNESVFYHFVTKIRSRSCEQERENTIGKITKMLIDAGLDPNGSVDGDENTPINLVCNQMYGGGQYKDDIKETLFSLGICDYNIANAKGITPLMGISMENYDSPENDLITLLEAGVDIAARDKEGKTALMYAAMNRNHGNGMTIADLLFSFGDPKPEMTDNEGKTAMDYAVESNNENLVKFLLNKM